MNFISTVRNITYFKVWGKLAEMNKVVFNFNFQAHEKLKDSHMPKPMLSLGFKYFNCILNLGNTGQIVALNFVLITIVILYSLIS